MKTPNFTTRVPTEMLERFREAADLWAKRNRDKQYLAGGESRNLTRWMLTVLTEEAKRELDIANLREAGCMCSDPLLGERPGVGPRCRLCNTEGEYT